MTGSTPNRNVMANRALPRKAILLKLNPNFMLSPLSFQKFLNVGRTWQAADSGLILACTSDTHTCRLAQVRNWGTRLKLLRKLGLLRRRRRLTGCWRPFRTVAFQLELRAGIERLSQVLRIFDDGDHQQPGILTCF